MTVGFLVVDKPGGITSNEVVSRVKRVTGVKKVGHAGTLDPMATGCVVVAIGNVTRLLRYVQDQPKEYHAVAEFGVSTDSLDADGSVLNREAMDVSLQDLEGVKDRFMGSIHQVPPMVSALKHEGRRLYELAREGVVIDRDAREVRVDELEFIDVGPGPYPSVEFRVVCGKGTYVRVLADDIAGALGGFAHLTSLRRSRTGSLSVSEHGVSGDHLEGWESHLLTASEALRDLPSVEVDEQTAEGISHGAQFVGGLGAGFPEAAPFRVLDEFGNLLAVYSMSADVARAQVVLPSS